MTQTEENFRQGKMRVSMPPCVRVAISMKSGRLLSVPSASMRAALASLPRSPLSLRVPRTRGQLRRRVEPPPVRSSPPRVLGHPVQRQQGRSSSCWSRAKRKSIHQITMPSSQPINSLRKALCAPSCSPTYASHVLSQRGTRGGKTRIRYTPLVLVCQNCLARRKLPSDH